VKHEIYYNEVLNDDDDVKGIELVIDDDVYFMDKGDVWNILSIANSVFNKMVSSE